MYSLIPSAGESKTFTRAPQEKEKGFGARIGPVRSFVEREAGLDGSKLDEVT